MITAVDTNILLDIFLPDPQFGETSLSLLEKAYRQGSIVINAIVYAELVPQFKSKTMLDDTLQKIGISIMPICIESAHQAGMMWKKYRIKTGRRDRIITDFLIGAFAALQADQFLTRDRGFYKEYFKGLPILGTA